MTALFDAIQTNDIFTENGMPTHSTSGSYVLDMFFKMGGSRNMSEEDIVRMFVYVFQEEPVLAVKSLLYNRDVRGGQGERRSFRVMFSYLAQHRPDVADAVLELVPEYGRWDDVLVALDTQIEFDMAKLVYENLMSGNSLTKKWMPREGKSNDAVAKQLMSLLELTPRQYRNLVANKDGDGVVETLMCDNKWAEINYSHVPSVASKNYRNAFARHDPDGYTYWLESLEKGDDPDVKINAGSIFPHDIVSQYLSRSNGLDRTLEQQWKSLPDYVPEGLSFLPLVDTSGSMSGLPLEVAVSLGIYLSERNKSVFKDGFITFSGSPKLQILKDPSLRGKVNSLVRAEWEMDTNLEKAFALILNKAVAGNVSPEDMPNYLVILSDMQFNECVEDADNNSLQMMRRMYEEAGYAMPQVVFWNLRTSHGTPVKFDESGTCLVSGFSPSLMQSLLKGELNPMNMMHSVLDSERYAPVEEALEDVL